MLSTTKRQRGLAAIVTVAGALGILTLSVVRQRGEDEAASRRWVGEQWDVARECLVGTPIGRGQSEAAIAQRMEVQLYEALVSAAHTDSPDLDALWPSRCVPRLAGLHRDAAIFRSDPEDALAQLEVLAPRVLRPAAGVPYAVGDRLEQVQELATAVAALDAAMPFGAEYDHEDFPAPHIDPADVAASMACRVPPATRPFLEEGALDALEGEVSWRLSEEEGRFARTISGPLGTREVPLEARGDQGRFVSLDGDVAWLDVETQQLLTGESAHDVSTVGGDRVSRFAPCFVDGHATQVAWATDDGVAWSAWPGPDGDLAPARPVEPTPPLTGSRMACNATDLVLAWFEEPRWRVVWCAGETCESLPPLAAQGDLQLAVGPAGVVALSTAPGSDLPVVRVAADADGWSEPSLGLRGTLGVAALGYGLATCDGTRRSEDGVIWRAVD